MSPKWRYGGNVSQPTAPHDNALQIETADEDGTYVIRLSGELDMSGCDAVEAQLRQAEAGQWQRILLDVEALTFIDSSGLQVILKAKRRADRGGRRLRVTRGKGHVADMFRLTALDMTLPFSQ